MLNALFKLEMVLLGTMLKLCSFRMDRIVHAAAYIDSSSIKFIFTTPTIG